MFYEGILLICVFIRLIVKIYINFHSSIDNQMFVYKLQFIIQ